MTPAFTISSPMTQLPAPTSLAEVQGYAKLFADSKLFSDALQVAQAAVKILAGAEIGIRPFGAMAGLHVIKGKVTISAGLMATLIKRSGHYNYRVTEHTDQVCTIAFFEEGEPCGSSTFTLDDAKKAALLANQTWQNYPRNLLFARALSNGARWYCADIFASSISSIYTHEEMGANVNSEGDVIDMPSYSAPASFPAALEETIQYTGEPNEPPSLSPAAEKAVEVARKEFYRTAALFGIRVDDMVAASRRAWFSTLLGALPEKFRTATWVTLAAGMSAYLQHIQDDETLLDPAVILGVAQRTWPEVGSLLQMSNAQWQGVVGMLEADAQEKARLQEIADSEPLRMLVESAPGVLAGEDARRTMEAMSQ